MTKIRDELLRHCESLGLRAKVNELDDYLVEDNLALHFVDFYKEKEPLQRWQQYYDKGVRCVFVYPTYNVEIYKNIISYHFGKVKRVFARKCEVRIVKAKEAKSFFEQNNIEGYRTADKAYCLYYNDELMMAYSVGHAFFGKGKYDLEIARGACKMGYQIVGGASKLWKHIIADNPLVQSIVYYVDRREYDGRSMKFLDNVDKTNFGGESFMNYWVKENRYANREPAKNSEITKGYKKGSIIQVKNPGSWTNIYLVKPEKYYVYKVTNKVSGAYYIGSKVTLNVSNYYIGFNYFTSSTDTKFVEDFKKNTMKWKHEVLKYFDSKQECLDYEADLIRDAWNNDREHLINRGWVKKDEKTCHVVSIDTPEVKAKISKALEKAHADPEYRKMASEKAKTYWGGLSDEQKQAHTYKIRHGQMNSPNYPPVNVNYSKGQDHSNKVKEGIIRNNAVEHCRQTKIANDTYGKAWNKGLTGLPSSGISKKVEIDGVVYDSISKACNDTGMKRSDVMRKAGMLKPKKENNLGENNPMYGKRHSDEAKKKCSEAAKQQTVDEINRIHQVGRITRDELMKKLGLTVKTFYKVPKEILDTELKVGRFRTFILK